MKNKLLLLLLLAGAAAFPQSGVLDTSFGTEGKVVTALGTNANQANAVAVLPDGKLLVGGTYISTHGEHDFALVRFNTDGTLDASFGTEGKVVTSFLENGHNYSFITAIYPLTDGKIITVGTSGVASVFSELVMVRYNADGSIDTGFGTNGKITSNLWPNSPGGSLVFLADGSFIITAAILYTATQNYDIGIEKYTANGSIDTTFGTNGRVTTTFAGNGNTGRNTPAALALKADGKFVIAGTYFQNNNPKLAVAQFNANGTLDTSFDGDGRAIANFGAGTYADGLQVFVAADGKIQVAGTETTGMVTSFALVQYTAGGSLDTTFDTDGIMLSPFAADDNYTRINSIIKQADGKFIVACKPPYFLLESADLVIRRYNADGSVDTTFGTAGKAATTFDTGANEVESAAITPDGKIVAVGKSAPSDNSHTEFAVALYNQNGTTDTTFNGNGKATVIFEKGEDILSILLVLPDDKLIAVGTSGYRQSNNFVHKDIVFSKYNADGSPDTSFGDGGRVYSIIAENKCTVITAVLQPDGKIVVSNMYYNDTQIFYSYEILRYNADGTLDTSFGTGGRVALNYSVTSIVFQPDGKIIVVGDGYINSAYAFGVNRFNANGTLDAGFGTNGYAYIPSAGATWGGSTAVLQADGKIVVFGSAIDPDVYAGAVALTGARLNANGTIDATFGTNGKVNALVGDVYFAYRCFLQADGKILIAGRSSGASLSFTTMRFTANGVLDTAYGTNGSSTSYLSEYRELRSVLLQPDGKFLVGLSKYNAPVNSYDFLMRRFNQDGTFDAGLNNQDGLATSFYNGYDEVFSIGLQSDYKIVVAGSTHSGVSKDFAMARYTNEVLGTGQFANDAPSVMIYPNPVKDVLNIRAQAGAKVTAYTVYNMLGQAVYNSPGGASALETGSFSKGIYTIEVVTTNGIVTKKFIKE